MTLPEWSTFWRRQKPKVETVIDRIHLRTLHGGITLDVWRKSDVRIRWAHDMFDTRMGRDMLAVLRNEMPSPVMVKPNGEADYDRAALGGAMVAGYKLALDTLLMLAEQPHTQADLPEADYSTEAGPQLIEDEEPAT